MLVKFVHTKPTSWSSFLDTCVFAFNTSRHESSKFTPFELMFGRKATLPIDIELRKETPEEVTCTFTELEEPAIEKFAEERAQRIKEAKANILVAQCRQKLAYDKKRSKPERYQVDELVFQNQRGIRSMSLF